MIEIFVRLRFDYYSVLLMIFFIFLFTGCIEEEPTVPEKVNGITLVGNDSRLALSKPSWSPLGDRLAVAGTYECGFGQCGSGVFTIDVRSHEILPFHEGGASNPVWTINPSEISYVSYGNNDFAEIYKIGLGGIPVWYAYGERISWSSDGRFSAIVRKEPYGLSGLYRSVVYVSNFGFSGQDKNVFETPESHDNEITGSAWSFNNSYLALSARWWAGDKHKSAVFIVNMFGYGIRQLAENIEQPGWMPDNQWLFFIKDEKLGFAPSDYACEKFPINVKGISSPTISPMGNQLAFVYESKIYVLDLAEIKDKLTCKD